MRKDEGAMAIFILLLGVFALPVIDVIWEGYVLMTLWGWFIVPTFRLPALTLALAIGVTCVIGLMTHQYVPSKENDNVAPIVCTFLFPAMMLLDRKSVV